jgi:DNA-directed RNA polymerase specialized sigma24 family protein
VTRATRLFRLRFEGRSQVSTWILSIARFKTLSALHRHRDTHIHEIDMELIEDSANTPEEVVLNRDPSAQLRICLAQMSRDHREILDLVYYQESPSRRSQRSSTCRRARSRLACFTLANG